MLTVFYRKANIPHKDGDSCIPFHRSSISSLHQYSNIIIEIETTWISRSSRYGGTILIDAILTNNENATTKLYLH